MRGVSRSVSGFGSRLRGVGTAMTARLTAPILLAGAAAVKKAADFETLRTALQTATGSAEAASAAFAMLSEFSSKTPFQLEELVSGFIKLKNRGIEPTIDTLTSFGNTAGAMGKTMDDMIEAVADAITGEFERLKEFGIVARTNGDRIAFTFRGTRHVVRKNAADIAAYLKYLGKVEFAGGMERQAATLHGAFSNLRDSVSVAMGKIGADVTKTTNLDDRVRRFAEGIGGLSEKFTALPEPIKELVTWAGLGVAAFGPVLAGLGEVAIGVGVLIAIAPQIIAGFAAIGTVAAAAFGALISPIGIAIAGVVALGIWIADIAKRADSLAEGFKIAFQDVIGSIKQAGEMLAGVLEFMFPGITKLGELIIDAVTLPAKATIDAITPPANHRDVGAHPLNILGAAHAMTSAAIPPPAAVPPAPAPAPAPQYPRSVVEVVFQNPPPGMRANITQNDDIDVAIEQGPSMMVPY